VADISDIERRNTSFSKTLTLPSTARNQQLFGNIFDISVANDIVAGANILSNFNPAKQAQSQIFLDNVKIFDGVLRLSKIVNREGDITYEVNMFGRLRDILDALGDLTLADLDFDDYDHTYNQANLEASWARTEWVSGAQNYVYPLVDYGYSTDNGITYPLKNFKPAVFVTEILERIFEEAEFEIQEPKFFESFFFKKLILLTAEKSITREVLNLLDQRTDSLIQPVTNVTNFQQLLVFNSVSAPSFTISNAGTRFTYNKTQGLNTGINLNVNLSFTSLETSTKNLWTVQILKNGSQIFSKSETVTIMPLGGTYNYTFAISGGVTLALNDYFEVRLTGAALGGGGFNPNIQNTVTVAPLGTFKIGSTIPVAVDVVEGDTMKINYTMPKSMKQRDFLKSIISMYNLYITQDKLQTNILEIIPYNEFFKTFKDEAIDWSDKLDVSQEVVITPLSELSAKEYRLMFDDDSDYWSQSYKTKFNEGYGEKREIIPNDFVTETKSVKVVFAPPVMREEVAGRVMVHLYKVENNVKIPDNFKPRIVFFEPQTPCPTSWNIKYAAAVPVTYNTYPYAGHVNSLTSPAFDQLFRYPNEVYFSIGAYPENSNLYTEYYDQLITSIGDRNSRLLEGYFYLTPTDISNLDFRTIIKVGNHFFQLQKVDKYNPIANGLSYVSLFKILGELEPQDYDYILLENDFYMLQENGVNKFYI
jgi:hypothetical protein